MADREFKIVMGILALAGISMGLDTAFPSYNVDPGFYPFLGVIAGGVLGRGWVVRRKNGNGGGDA